MEEQKNNGNLNPDTGNEIDLLALFVSCCQTIGRAIVACVKGIGIALTACFNFCLRHFFWLLGGLVSGLLITIIAGPLLSRKNYVTGEAKLSCYTSDLTNIQDEINKINQMIASDNTSFFVAQSLLGLDPQLTLGLKTISFGYGMDIDNDTIADFVEYTPEKARNLYTEKTLKGGSQGDKLIKIPIQQKVPNIFFMKIETQIDDLQKLTEIGHAVCDYLNNLPTLQEQLQLQRLAWENDIIEIDRQKTLLDSMLRIEYFINSRLKAASYGQGAERLVLADQKQVGIPFDYKDIIALTSQKNTLQTLLATNKKSINIVSDFQPVPTSQHSKKIWLGIIWLGLFIVSALVYEYRKPIGQYIKAQRQR